MAAWHWDEGRSCLVHLFALVLVLESLRRDRLPHCSCHRHSHHFHTTLIPHHIHLHHSRIHNTSLLQPTHTTFTRTTHITHTSHHDHIHTHYTPQHTTSHHDHIHLSLGDREWRLCLAAGLQLIEINGRERRYTSKRTDSSAL